MPTVKPMLAGKVTRTQLADLNYPLYVQPKLDGIRCIIRDGVALSRKLKPIPNEYLQFLVENKADYLGGFDGELIVGDPTDEMAYRKTMSGAMAKKGSPDFTYHVYDAWNIPERGFQLRFAEVSAWLEDRSFTQIVPTKLVESPVEVIAMFESYVAVGYEGIILRAKDGLYKYGRSTVKEQYLLKYKEFDDAEAVVVGFEERMHNANKQEKDERGYAKRSTARVGLVPTGTLGALVCVLPESAPDLDANTFKIGTGFDDETRQEIWDNQSAYLGKLVKFKHFPSGAYSLPRFPVFIGWREEMDT